MAKSKSKNDIKITSIKKNSIVVKKGAKTTTVRKKPRAPKKRLEVVDEVKKEEIKETEIIKKPTKKKASTQRATARKNAKPTSVNKSKELTQEELIAQKKERNRKKYQNQQKKYQETRKNKDKKKIVVEDKIDDNLKKSNTVKEEELVKKVKDKEEETKEKIKEKERKEKRKSNRKSINFTQTITNLKDISITKINNVKDKVNDKHIPVGKTRDEKARRSKRFIKEAIIYAIILTIIDILCILIFDYFNFIRLFDVKALNIILTIIIALVFNFFVTFMVDYFVTGVWLQNKRKKKVGEQDGDNRTIEEEHREDIKDKEGE